MIEYEELSYAAVVTITLPDGQQTRLALRLNPPDQVVTGAGAKPLRTCTLAELQHFADQLEAEVWSAFFDKKIVELASHAATSVKLTVIKEQTQEVPELDVLLNHTVVLEEQPAGPADADIPAPSDGSSGPDKAAVTGPGAAHPSRSVDDRAVAPSPDDSTAPELSETSVGDGERTDETSDMADRTVAPAPASAVDSDASGAADDDADAGAQGPDQAPSATVTAPEHPPLTETDDVSAAPARLRIAGRRRPLDHPTWAMVDILINEPTLRKAQKHALGSMSREVAGMLVGPPPEQKKDGRWIVHITDLVSARYTEMRGASVTYTPESWRYVHDVLAERYPDESAVIVGWYHTHPGFGIFLSGMDLFIHQHFFTQPWHVAFVLDPQARISGFFCWDRQQAEVRPYEFPWPEWAPDSW